MEKVVKFLDFENINEAKESKKKSGEETAKDACVNVGKTLSNAKLMIDGEIEELNRIHKKWKKDTKSVNKDLKDISKELNKVIIFIKRVSEDYPITYIK